MLTAVKGYYNGTTFVFDKDIACEVEAGQEVILTFMDRNTSVQKSKNLNIDLSQFVIPYERGENGEHIDAQDYVRGLRDNDRL